MKATWVWCLSILSVLVLCVHGSAAPNDNWDDRFSLPGVNGQVEALATVGSDVYVGGRFTQAGESNITSVARWDGRRWWRLGAGMSNTVSYDDFVYALTSSGSNLYVGGSFRIVGSNVNSSLIARWDGRDWSALGPGITDAGAGASVFAIAVVGNSVYAGGNFRATGAFTATNIARWNGVAWSGLPGNVSGTINALAVIGSDLYVGGGFIISGIAANLARWDGNSWSPVTVNGPVLSLAVLNGDLYVRGAFTQVGGSIPADGLARWNGASWSTPHVGFITNISHMAGGGGHVYVGGSTLTNPKQSRLARYDGLNWSTVGGDGHFGEGLSFLALTVCQGSVYLGGGTGSPLDTSNLMVNGIIKWEGDRWQALGQGLEFVSNVLLATGTNIYAGPGGRVGGHAVNRIARWDGARWHPLGLGITDTVSSLTAITGNDTNLFVGGSFAGAGGVPANRLARWDGSSWSALGSGIAAGTPRALALIGTNLYVGGNFAAVGGVAAANIARWDGSTWSPVGGGVGGTILAMLVHGNDLYIGGTFGRAGTIDTACVARWDGTNWYGYGTEFFSSTVNALAIGGTNLYIAGGLFTFNNPNISGIARWNGSIWTNLGTGVASGVSLVARGNEVWVGGQFTTAGGVPASRIAKWDGTSWSALGSGLGTTSTSHPTTLALLGDVLYGSGGFVIADGKRSKFFGAWHVPRPTLGIAHPDSFGFVITWTSEPNQTYRVYSTTSLSAPFTPVSGPIASAGTTTSYTNSSDAPSRFYRVQVGDAGP